MGKTFEEWYGNQNDDGWTLQDEIEEALENRMWDTHLSVKYLLKEARDASRQNMTTKDI